MAEKMKEPTAAWYVWACTIMRLTNILTLWVILLSIAWLIYG